MMNGDSTSEPAPGQLLAVIRTQTEIAKLRLARDGRAAYYLGNALASLLRDSEALESWRTAVQLDPSNALAERNLALALWHTSADKTSAAAAFTRAISLQPNDFRLYLEFNQMLDTNKRIELLEQFV